VFAHVPRENLRRPSFLGPASDHGHSGPALMPAGTPRPAARSEAAPAPPPPQPLPVLDIAALNEQVAERIAEATERLRQTADHLAAEARLDALEVGFMVARRILESEVSANVESLLGLVRSALRRLGEARQVMIHLCPEDAKTVEKVLATTGTQAISATAAQIEVVADTTLGRGDCVVEGNLGTVDGRINTRLEELYQALRQGDWQENP
jgi:flagellar biosynthesis/type III secretory pathway protein FliH